MEDNKCCKKCAETYKDHINEEIGEACNNVNCSCHSVEKEMNPAPPWHRLPKSSKEAVAKLNMDLDGYILPPTELFRVLNNRTEVMVYMPANKLIDLVWKLADEITNKG